MNVETAVIGVAGAGTRIFPISTAIEKFMMPIYIGQQSRPVIDFIVEDCAVAGIKRIIFVTSERGKIQLREYFEGFNRDLERQLKRLGRNNELQQDYERRKSLSLTYEYIIQSPDQYGTAVPPFLAKNYLRGEARFAVLSGDDFVYRQDNKSELSLAAEQWDKCKTTHVIMGKSIPRAEATKYGILDIDSQGRLKIIDEKPPLEHVPKDPIANISSYLLSNSLWPYIEKEMGENRSKREHNFTYVINSALAGGQSFHVHPVQGEYIDGGNFDGLLRGSQFMQRHPRVL